MPSSMTHLLCAKMLTENNTASYFVGNIAPDCIDIREFKDKTHFRDIEMKDRLDALRQMARSLDLQNPYLYGAVYHLFADYTWDNGPQKLHKKLYKGDNWFPDYRFDINECGREIYLRYSWSQSLFDEMKALDESEYSFLPEYPTDAIRRIILKTEERSKMPLTKKSEIFTPEVVDDYARETAERFMEFARTV